MCKLLTVAMYSEGKNLEIFVVKIILVVNGSYKN